MQESTGTPAEVVAPEEAQTSAPASESQVTCAFEASVWTTSTKNNDWSEKTKEKNTFCVFLLQTTVNDRSEETTKEETPDPSDDSNEMVRVIARKSTINLQSLAHLHVGHHRGYKTWR